MALVKFGGNINEIRGRFEGLVYSRNGSGSFVRCQKRPTNPKSDAQGLGRNNWSLGISQWRSLSVSDKALWDAYALSPPEVDVDPWGNQRFLSGYQWAMRVWQRQQFVGDDLITTPGSSVPVVAPTGVGLSMDVESGVVLFSYDSGSFSTGDSLIATCYLGRMGSQNATYSGYYNIWAGSPATSTSTDFWAYITALVGFLQITQYYKIQVWRQTSEGIRSPVTTFEGLAT